MLLRNRKEIRAKKQRGFVLVLAMILLSVLTLIGVSSMNSANMELKSAANAQQHQVAFNGVQSLLEYIMSVETALLVDWQDVNPQPPVAYTLPNTSSLTATVTYAGCAKAAGGSLESGKGFAYNYFDVVASGANATGTATSQQNQGVRYPAASCGL